MAKIRHQHNAGASSIPWSTAQDGSLSFTARGVLVYCLSLPPGWEFSADRVAKTCDIQGRKVVLSAFRELDTAGYRRLTTERNEQGHFSSFAEFSSVPIPEWIESNAEDAAKKTGQKKRGPKSSGAKAVQDALEQSRTKQQVNADDEVSSQVAPEFPDGRSVEGIPSDQAFPQVAPEFPSGRSAGEFPRGGYKEKYTHTVETQVEESASAAGAEAVTSVCVEASPTKNSTDGNDIADVPHGGHVLAAQGVLKKAVPAAVATAMTDAERNKIVAAVADLLSSGWSAVALRPLMPCLDEATRYPYRMLSNRLAEISEQPPRSAAGGRADAWGTSGAGDSEEAPESAPGVVVDEDGKRRLIRGYPQCTDRRHCNGGSGSGMSGAGFRQRINEETGMFEGPCSNSVTLPDGRQTTCHPDASR